MPSLPRCVSDTAVRSSMAWIGDGEDLWMAMVRSLRLRSCGHRERGRANGRWRTWADERAPTLFGFPATPRRQAHSATSLITRHGVISWTRTRNKAITALGYGWAWTGQAHTRSKRKIIKKKNNSQKACFKVCNFWREEYWSSSKKLLAAIALLHNNLFILSVVHHK